MGCNHEKVRCTNDRFFCLICGQEIKMPKADPKADEKELEKEPEKAAKKTVRKKAGKE